MDFHHLLQIVLSHLTWTNYLRLALYLPVATFVFFVLVMGFERGQSQLTPELQFFGRYVLLPIGMAHNFLLNVLVASVVFLDIPREFTTTGRLDRYWRDGKGGPIRARVALFIRLRLDPFDPRGIHS